MSKSLVYIFHNPLKPKAVSFREELELYLKERGVSLCENVDEATLYIVLGGDGTLLNFSKQIIGQNKPVLAVNMGSLGFLTDVRQSEALDILNDVLQGDYEYESRHFLEVTIDGNTYYALNDFVVSKCGIHSRMVSVSVTAEGEYVTTYRADGVIIATPTGSTAYSFSSGGPIVKPGLSALVITPIAPHNLNARPIVVPGDNNILIEPDTLESELHVMLDGQTYISLDKNLKATVTLSQQKIDLIKSFKRSYYDILREKLKWGDKLC